MGSLTVLLAPRGPASGMLDVLRDWSALGLVNPFGWIEADTVTNRVPALLIEGGRPRPVFLDALLATGNTRFDPIRICVIVPMVGDTPVVPSAVEQQVATVIALAGGGRDVTRIRLVLARAGINGSTATPAQEGWHNLVLAPEDSEGPDRGLITLPDDDDPVDLGRHAAAAVAGVAGLWSGADRSPFDGMPVLPGESLRMVRSYYRRLQTSALEGELRSRVTSTQRAFPLPNANGASATYVENVELATSTMAKSLWARHAGVLRGPRVEVPRQAESTIGFAELLKLFFGFLLSALKNAPGNWYRSVVNRVSSGAARAVHSAVFGSVPVAYRTVVNGRTDTGVPASWIELGQAATQVEQALSGSADQAVHHARPDLSRLWQDFAAGALTLADAGVRVDGLNYVEVGTTRSIVRSPVDIAPDESADFTGLSGNILAAVGSVRIPVRDVMGAEDLANRLRFVAQDPTMALEAGRAQDNLKAWRAANSRAYVVQVGNYFGGALTSLSREIGTILGRLSRAGATGEAEQAEQNRQRKLARWQKILFFGFLLLLVGLGVLVAVSVIGVGLFGILAAVLLLVWIISAMVLFYRGQQALFAEMHRRRESASQADADSKNLREALRDFRRVSDAYHQFLAWSEVLGSLLSAPFGPVPQASDDIRRLTSGLPLAARVGVAGIDEAAVGEAAVVIRRDLFRFGWLTQPWETTLSGAAGLIGPEAFDLRSNPQLMFSQQAVGPDSLLRMWADRLTRARPSRAGGDQLWDAVIAQLQTERAELVPPLLGKISVPGTPGTTGISEFMTGVDRTTPTFGMESFDGSLLTPQARTAGHAAVAEPNAGFTHSSGLGRVAVLTQMTEGLPIYEFNLVNGEQPAEADDTFVIPELLGHDLPLDPPRRQEDEPEPPTEMPGIPGISF